MANNLFELFNEKTTESVASKPLNLESLSNVREEQDLFIEKISDLENVKLKIDYSNFSNFVFYNSALDYFNITGEKIINDYPIDGTIDYLHKFLKDLDGYQNYVLEQWPKYCGHLRFNTSISSSFIKIEDVGTDGTGYRTGLLNPNTGSMSFEMWFNPHSSLTGSNDIVVLAQKTSGSNSISLFLTGSNISFQVTSGSTTTSVSTGFVANQNQYVAAVMDRTSYSGSLVLITGSTNSFPIFANSSSLSVYGNFNLGDSPLYICSGTLSGKTTRFFTGSLDEVKVWKSARSLVDVSSSFNVKQYAQKGLVALYRFNESGSSPFVDENKIVLDYSGNKLNGRIQNYYSALRATGSMLVQESEDPLLSLNFTEVTNFIYQNQVSGSNYDKSNNNKIVDLLPESFFNSEDEEQNKILTNFLYVAGRHFDSIKTHIDQFKNILSVNYSDYNQTPDVLLDVVAKFFGWEFTGNFLNSDAFQYLLGKNVLTNIDSNKELDVKLYQIKNEFWKRTLLNLIYLYKTKGTRESVSSLMRIYGVNENFVKLKEYSKFENVSIKTNRIFSEKSVPALGFGSGSLSGSVTKSFSTRVFDDNKISIETRIKFPLTSSSNIQSTFLTGSVWTIVSGSSYVNLSFQKDSISSYTGSLILSASDAVNCFSISNVPIFNNEWQNICFVINPLSSSLELYIKKINDGDIEEQYSASASFIQSGALYDGDWRSFSIGSTGSKHGQYWMQEVRVWEKSLTNDEINDHTYNFQSYGVNDPILESDKLILHWRLNENVTSSLGSLTIFDFTKNSNSGTGINFLSSQNPYKKFLNEYSYIAPMDFGWNEDKIRVFDSSKIKNGQFVNDEKIVSLEFNMIDSLNEDMEQMCKSLDFMNNVIGKPTNKYNVEYSDLEILRHNYFKKLEGRLNFNVFYTMLDFFDRNFIEMIKKLIPARANFVGEQFVVESHLFERPKVSYEKRPFQEIIYQTQGNVKIYNRFSKNRDGSGPKFPLFLSGSS